MPQIPFSDRKIASLPYPDKGQVDYFDSSTRGLGLRVSYGGTKAWFLKYLYHGRQRRMTLGRYPRVKLAEARRLALDAKHEAHIEGQDPALRRKSDREAETLRELVEVYVEEYAKPRKRSWREDQRILFGEYFSPFHGRKAAEIERGEVVERLQVIKRTNGPVMANRCLASIRKMYSWAIRNGKIDLANNPAMNIDRPSGETERDRVYSENELRALWKAFDQIGISGPVFKMVLATGQRLGEVAGMEWAEIEGNQWTIPAARTKNKRPHVVPLTDIALEILEAVPRANDQYVFASPQKPGQPITNLGKGKLRARKLSEVVDFRTHDLRRSAATGITKLGFPRFIADRVLNHVEGGVGRVYDRNDYFKEKTEALDAWARHLRGVIGEGGNVVQLKGA